MRTNVIFAIIAGLIFSACNIDASITQLEEVKSAAPQIASQKMQGEALTSGGQTKQVATGGYHVYSTVGGLQSKIVESSSGGYKVYMNLNGQIHSE